MNRNASTDYPTEPLGLVVTIQAPRVDARCQCGWLNTTRIRSTGRFDLLCGACGLPFTISVIGGLPDEPPAAPAAPAAGRGDHGAPTPSAVPEATQQGAEAAVAPVVAGLDQPLGDEPEPAAAGPAADVAGLTPAAMERIRDHHQVTPRRAIDLNDPTLLLTAKRWVEVDAAIRDEWQLLGKSHGTGLAIACAARRRGWTLPIAVWLSGRPPLYRRDQLLAVISDVLRRRGITIPATGGEQLEPAGPQMPVTITEDADATELADHGHGAGDHGQPGHPDQGQPGQGSLLDLLRRELAEEKASTSDTAEEQTND